MSVYNCPQCDRWRDDDERPMAPSGICDVCEAYNADLIDAYLTVRVCGNCDLSDSADGHRWPSGEVWCTHWAGFRERTDGCNRFEAKQGSNDG